MSRDRTALGLLALLLSACAGAPAGSPPPPTRGYVLLSLAGLRADSLGRGNRVVPFLDALAAESVRFERAIAPCPNSLTSLTTLFTGLHPREHGVFPPNRLLAPGLETLPESFAAAGYRTIAFTENRLLGPEWGFHRGFQEFGEPIAGGVQGMPDALERALERLAELGPGERFFLFLQSEALAAPFAPPPPWEERFVTGLDRERLAAAATLDALAVRDVNQGFSAPDPELVPALEALYEIALARFDQRLREFFERLAQLGLRHATTVVVTADRGQELLEHGALGADQVYPESVHVPLLVLHPRLAPRAVPHPVGLVDLAPTLRQLARLPPGRRSSGRSLAAELVGRPPTGSAVAYSEVLSRQSQQALYVGTGADARLYVRTTVPQQRDGAWIARAVELDTRDRTLPFRLVSFQRVRQVEVLVDGQPLAVLEARPRWREASLTLPPGSDLRRVRLQTAECESPKRLGLSQDARCLSFKVGGLDLTRTELFDLAADPGAERDLARQREDEAAELGRLLDRLAFPPALRPELISLTPERRRILASLGYLE